MDPGVGAIVTQFDPRVAAVLGWVTLIIKVFVDWIKTALVLPKWASPLMAFGAGLIVLLLLMTALGIPLSAQLVAQAVLSSMIATVLAIGSTALQERTRPSPDPPLTTGSLTPEQRQQIVADIKAEMMAAPAEPAPLISRQPAWLPGEREAPSQLLADRERLTPHG